MRIQLVYFSACPNVAATRDALRRALAASGLPPSFEEVDVDAPGAPDRLRAFGSPAIVVDGSDLLGGGEEGCACRLYGGNGAPTEGAIRAAFLEKRAQRSRWIRSAIHLPGAILPLLPAATCPFCIAAYAGVVSSIGLGFLLNEQVLVPLILAFLALSTITVAWSTRSHRHPGPLAATLAGAAAVVAGRVLWPIPPLVYAGVFLLVAASLWNLWLKRPRQPTLLRLGSLRNPPSPSRSNP